MPNAVAKVDLANFALAKLTKDRIRDIDSKEPGAVQTALHMEAAIFEFIEEFDWPEARVIAAATAVSDDIDTRGWTYAYQVPSDLLVLWWVGDITSPFTVPFELGMSKDISSDTTYIFTNQASAYLRYGSKRVGLSRFAMKQIDLIALKLAIKCCLMLGQDKRYRQGLLQEYKTDLSALKTLYANREPEVIDPEFTPELISVRTA